MENADKNLSPPFNSPTVIFFGSPGIKKPEKPPRNDKLIRCSNYFSEYCDKTTLHGFKYLGEQKRSLLEKIWWIALLLLSLYLCTDLILRTNEKWKSSPIIIAFKQNPVPGWKVPFPAITICPMVKIRQSIFNYTDYMNKYFRDKDSLGPDVLNQMHDLSLICDEQNVDDGGNDYITKETLNFFKKIGSDFNKVTRHLCRWRNKDINCIQYFIPILTHEGVCYTFNMLDRRDLFKDIVAFNGDYMSHNKSAKEWDFVKGYSTNASLDSFPYRDIHIMKKRNTFYGITTLLSVTESDVDYSCTGLEQGFKIYYHHPAEILLGGEDYVLAPLNYDVFLTIRAEAVLTADELKNYPPNVRQCYYPHEKELAFFKIYTQKNCEMECLSNYTKAICGCTAFYMPREKNTKICGPNKIPCMDYVRVVNMAYKEAFNFNEEHIEKLMVNDLYESKKDYLEFEGNLKDMNKSFDIKSCNCRQSCTTVRYEVTKDDQIIDWQKYIKQFGLDENTTAGELFVLFTALYTTNDIVVAERKELFGIIEMIGNCGGILGLFTGFSFLSLFEIIYYLSLRVWCNFKQSSKVKTVRNNNILFERSEK